jgi:hypothetical protein
LAVSCPSSTYCVAVGQEGDYPTRAVAEHWDGRRWHKDHAPGDASALEALSCASKRLCFATGPPGVFARWDGRHWTSRDTDIGFNDIFCRSGRDCVAVGATFSGDALAARWTGHRLIRQLFPRTPHAAFSGVSCPSAKVCIAVGSDDPGLLVAYSGLARRSQRVR